jgi:hypothetical protein
MSWADLTNGSFELLGGVLLLQNCRRLLRDRVVKGIDWRITVFFQAWGIWNLYFYPSLDQWLSFTGGLVMVVVNTAWVAMAIYFRRNTQ